MDLSKFGNHTSPSKFHPKFLTHPLQTLHDQTHIYANTNSFSKYYAKSEEFRWLIRKVKQYSLRHDLSFRGYDTRLIPADVLRVMYIRYQFPVPDFSKISARKSIWIWTAFISKFRTISIYFIVYTQT